MRDHATYPLTFLTYLYMDSAACSASGYLTAAPAAGSSSRRVAVVSPVLPLEDGPVAVRSQILTEDARGRQRRQLAVFRARAKIAVPKGDKNVGSDASEFI